MKVREKAKHIFGLVTDSFKLKDEKKKFNSWKSRIEGVGSGSSDFSSKKKNFGKDGANAYGATSSSSYGGTISTYYDKNKDKNESSNKKKKEVKEESDSESSSEEDDNKDRGEPSKYIYFLIL